MWFLLTALELLLCLARTDALLHVNPTGPSLAMAFIVRDEEVNIRTNLPDFVDFVDYYVFMVDRRTSDGSLDAIEEILGGKRNYHIEMYDFDGFGPARTASLQTVWKHYSNATHVWISDPDWKAEVDTIKKDELTMDADAFRFMIYDRNGYTTRRCDWLLRNKPNLKMRYHLHEVLDIGETYVWKEISWIVHEIEQAGSWHNKVGHSTSHASKRYIFDLTYLEKDLQHYRNDAHTDYYLGVTHHAYVEALVKEAGAAIGDLNAVQPSGRSIAEHMELAIKFLTRRATGTYEREFIEERWGVMFLLGSIYSFMSSTYDLAQGERWYRMCRDYNPGQMECSLNLIMLYMNAGLYDKMMAEFNSIITTESTERTMMNHYGLKTCSIPSMAVHVLSLSDAVRKSSSSYNPAAVKYMQALAISLDTEMCYRHDSTMYERSIQHVSRVMSSNGEFYRKGLFTLNSLCSDEELHNYLVGSKIVQHPCESFSQRQQAEKYCSGFYTEIAPSQDTLQLIYNEEYVGAANLYDIVHHAYAGDSARVFKKPSGKYNILFAQYFNNKNIFSLLKQLLDHPNGNQVNIFILTASSELRTDIEQHIQFCLANNPSFQKRSSIENYGITFVNSLDLQKNNMKFDYIEFSGGMSRSVSLEEDMKLLNSLLEPDGVLGLTAFSTNKYTKEFDEIKKKSNTSVHEPFSAEPFRMAKDYLKANGFNDRAKVDRDLMFFLAQESDDPEKPKRSFSRDGLVEKISSFGLKVVSFSSGALSSPYDEFSGQYSIQKWKSLGMLEANFVDTFISPFRYTVYAGKSGANLPGRPRILEGNLPENAVFVDRSRGNLAKAFSGLQHSPGVLEGLKVPLLFQLKLNMELSSADDDKVISVYLSPDVVAGLTLLPTSPTVSAMLSYNSAVRASSLSVTGAKFKLLNELMTLEKLNLVSVWIPTNADSNRGNGESDSTKPVTMPAASEGDSAGNQNLVSMLREYELKRQEKVKAMQEMGFTQSVIDTALAAEDAEFQAAHATKKSRTISALHDSTTATEEPLPNTNTRGIKQVTKKSRAGKNIAKNSESSTSVPNSKVDAVISRDGPGEVPLSAVMPGTVRRQTKKELDQSFRQQSCQVVSGSGNDCFKRVDQVRISSDSKVTSISKLRFDLNQLRYIVFEHATSANPIISETLIFAYQNLIDELSESVERRGDSRTSLLSLSGEDIAATLGYINSVIHVVKEPILKEGDMMCHRGALNKMPELLAGLSTNDFVMMDSLLESRSLRMLSTMLLGSTVWFDVGNGNMFFSHHNDGLIFDRAQKLAMELSESFGSDVVLNKYTAVGIPLYQGGISPVFFGLEGEFYAVVWLNSFASPAADDNDGLIVYGEGSAQCLRETGGMIDSSKHPDFVSANNGDLDIQIDVLCGNNVDSELLPRKHSRLVLIAPNRPFAFSSPGDESLNKKPFDAKTGLALVLSLSKKN